MFTTTLLSVLMTFVYLTAGFLLRQANKGSEEHLSTLSSILVYIGTPFLQVSAFMQLDFSWEAVETLLYFFLFTLGVQALFYGIVFLLLKKKSENIKIRIMGIGTFVGNVGFMGLPIVKSLFPDNPIVSCYSVAFMLSMNLMIFTVGTFALTGDKRYISVKQALVNPATIGCLVGVLFFVFGLEKILPVAVTNGISAVGSLTTPLCMFILGIRLASSDLKSLFRDGVAFLTVGIKLLLFPLFCYLAVYFLPVDETFKACALVLASSPCAAVLLSLSEIYRSEPEFSAHVLLLSQISCIATMPLLTLLL